MLKDLAAGDSTLSSAGKLQSSPLTRKRKSAKPMRKLYKHTYLIVPIVIHTRLHDFAHEACESPSGLARRVDSRKTVAKRTP